MRTFLQSMAFASAVALCTVGCDKSDTKSPAQKAPASLAAADVVLQVPGMN